MAGNGLPKEIGDGSTCLPVSCRYENIPNVEKQFSGHPASEQWDRSTVTDDLLARSTLATDDGLIVADSTDLAN